MSSLGQTVTFFLISDLHAFSPADGRPDEPSFLDISLSDTDFNANPFAAVNRLVATEALTADYLICCGDFGDRAHPTAIKFAWDHVIDLASKLKTKHIIATVGNHDLDSRFHYNDYDARGFLQSLSPSFPHTQDDDNDRFWSRHFTVFEHDNVRIVNLNTSAYHGYSQEHQYGRISKYTLQRLQKCLATLQPKPLNVLVCHHNPQKQSELGLGDSDDTKNGQLLLDLIGGGCFGDWIVFHGHKHCPKLTYASGGANAPIVFSVGSFSCCLYPELYTQVRNQCYLVEIDLSEVKKFGLVGRFWAWDWAKGAGWRPAGNDSGLPAHGGFGCRWGVSILANKIQEHVNMRASWSELQTAIPELKYILPADFDALRSRLSSKFSISPAGSGCPEEIERI